MLWILLPSSCVWVPQLQTDRRELSKQICQVSQASPVRVNKVGLPEKEKPCSWKTSKLLAFCLLRSLWRKWCWGSRCLLLVTWIHWVFGFLWWWRKKGTWGERDLQGVTRGREWVVGRSGCLAGWVGVAVSLPFSLGKKLAFPKSYSEWKPQCTLSQLV